MPSATTYVEVDFPGPDLVQTMALAQKLAIERLGGDGSDLRLISVIDQDRDGRRVIGMTFLRELPPDPAP